MERLRTMFLDFFRGREVTKLALDGIHHVIVCSVENKKIFFRMYKIKYFHSETKIPRTELEECGPSFDCTLGRHRLASEDLFKEACKMPKQAKPSKVKNVGTTALGETKGTLHMNKQKFERLQTRKMRGLKRARPSTSSQGSAPSSDKEE
eukprot:c13702_g1_i1.p2 GENE.c13702_g1_i1~~c13702_g1_i1.p2  ORF type:complete len:150 (+),score=29.37 c13702_g1_i1:554-1003(+)